MKVFISYTSSDREWAHWIGWQLQSAGHEPFVHDWEIGAGENIAGWMEERFKQAERLIGVFSDGYCKAAFSQSERWGAYWQDPRGRSGFLVPIEVRPVSEWPGFVRPLKRLSLVDLDEAEASRQLLAFLQPPHGPTEKPTFPGGARVVPDGTAAFTEGSEPLGIAPPSFPAAPPITPHIPNPNTDIRCIDDHEPKPQIFGRDDEVETVVKAVLDGTIALIAGGPGMGKTAVATVALYDHRVVARYCRRRVFASLEAATEPRAILAKLVEALGLPPTGDEVSLLRILETNAADEPIAAILDNVETVFDADRSASERLLSLAARIKGLSLVVTIRGVAPPIPGAIQIDDISKLAPIDAREAFLAVAGSSFKDDPDLPHILDALDGHALSIHLVAAQAIGLPSLNGLRESWDEAHAEILSISGEREGRLTSVRVSLSLSLNSRRMTSVPLARRLIALLAFLPGGLAEGDVHGLLAERGVLPKARANEAVICLHQLRLVERRPDRRLRTLTPLRECAKIDVPPLDVDRRRMINHFMELAVKANTIGSATWEEYRELVENESDNLDAICELLVERQHDHKLLQNALSGLAAFHQFSGRGSISSLNRAVARLRSQPPSLMAASCIRKLGEIARDHAELETARSLFQEALGLCRRLSYATGEGNCIENLGQIALGLFEYEIARRHFQEALSIARRIKNKGGEANCVHFLGDIAHICSDQELAAQSYEESQTIYRSIGGILGVANCIQSRGILFFERWEHTKAEALFMEASALFSRIGHVRGEAQCMKDLGDVARSQSDFETARSRYEKALGIVRHFGNVLDEANCTLHLGLLAWARFDYDAAYLRFQEALALNRRVGNFAGEAESLIRLGRLQLVRAEATQGLSNIEAGFALYFSIAATGNRALPGWQSIQQAFITDDLVEAGRHRELARSSWTAIRRLDLVHDWVDLP